MPCITAVVKERTEHGKPQNFEFWLITSNHIILLAEDSTVKIHGGRWVSTGPSKYHSIQCQLGIIYIVIYINHKRTMTTDDKMHEKSLMATALPT